MIRGQDFRLGIFGATVQVSAKFNSGDMFVGALENVSDDFGSGVASGVRERDGANANVFQPFESFFDEFGPPGLVVWISEGHGNVNDEAATDGFGFLVNRFHQRAGFATGHVGVCSAKVRGDGIRVADGGDARRRQRAL